MEVRLVNCFDLNSHINSIWLELQNLKNIKGMSACINQQKGFRKKSTEWW